MTREYRIRDEDAARLGPVVIAMFIEAGWMRSWPLAITRTGFRMWRAGWGTHRMPYDTGPSRGM
jgi:hypothetical protein